MIGAMHLTVCARLLAFSITVALMAGACMASQDVITGAWTLVEINGSSPAAEASLSLLPDGKFTMRPGCNTGGGIYAIDGNRLDTDEMSLTMMACGDASNVQEQAVVSVLDADPRFGIDTGTGRLRLTAGDGTTLLFESA
jgi:heat shock protein HslJ